jgi:hypothetical protein
MLFLQWEEKQKGNYLFLDVSPSSCAIARSEEGVLDLETYRSRPRSKAGKTGFFKETVDSSPQWRIYRRRAAAAAALILAFN